MENNVTYPQPGWEQMYLRRIQGWNKKVDILLRDNKNIFKEGRI
jgi:hypothetical protein